MGAGPITRKGTLAAAKKAADDVHRQGASSAKRVQGSLFNPRRSARKNPRYAVKDKDDRDWIMFLDAGSAPEAMVEARRKTGKRYGRYDVVRLG